MSLGGAHEAFDAVANQDEVARSTVSEHVQEGGVPKSADHGARAPVASATTTLSIYFDDSAVVACC
jgi:hypothetical protein